MQLYQKILIVIGALAVLMLGLFFAYKSFKSSYEQQIEVLQRSLLDERSRNERVLNEVTNAYKEASLAREREFKKMNEELSDVKKQHEEALKFIDDWKKGKSKKIIQDAGGDPDKLAEILSSKFGYEVKKNPQ